MLTMLPSYFWSAPSRQCPPINAFVAPLGLSYSWPKTKLQNVGAGDPSWTILIDHGSYVIPTTDRLTRGIDPRGWEVLTPWKYIGRSEYVLTPQNVTFFHSKLLLFHSIKDEQLDTITSPSLILLMLTMLPSLSDQAVSSNQCIYCYTGYLSWPKRKLQNVGADEPPSTILIDGDHGVPVEGVEESIYLGSKQSSNGYCQPDVLRRIGLACSVTNSLQRVWNCSSLSISTKVHLYQSLIRFVLL